MTKEEIKEKAIERPIRNIDEKDYHLYEVEDSTNGVHHYYVMFIDYYGIEQCVEVSVDEFQVFDSYELKEKSHKNRTERYGATSLNTSSSINQVVDPRIDDFCDEIVSRDIEEGVWNAIGQLTPMQKKYIILYYWARKTEEEIAALYSVSRESVSHALIRAQNRMRTLLEKTILPTYLHEEN